MLGNKLFDITITSDTKNQFINMTGHIVDKVKNSGVINGSCTIYTLHTTCGITINENADPDVLTDLPLGLDKIVLDFA